MKKKITRLYSRATNSIKKCELARSGVENVPIKKWAPKRKTSKKCPFIYADHLHLFAWSHDLYLRVFLRVFCLKMRKHKCMTMQISANVLHVKQEPYFYKFLSNFPPPPTVNMIGPFPDQANIINSRSGYFSPTPDWFPSCT